jgi:hypothetical protein
VKARSTAARFDRLSLTPSLTPLFPRQYSLLHTCARRHLVMDIIHRTEDLHPLDFCCLED